MTILRGTVIGLGLSGLCGVGLFYLAVYRHLLPRIYIVSHELHVFVLYNPFWWITVLGSFAVGFIFASKIHRKFLWITIAATGCVALYLGFGYMLRHLN